MELEEYLPMFLAEAREHLEHLNLAVVRIEERPDDRETVDEIFRIAHSLKGMSATMGFSAMAALTHKMEDVFELLRQRAGGLERKAIDVLLACLDAVAPPHLFGDGRAQFGDARGGCIARPVLVQGAQHRLLDRLRRVEEGLAALELEDSGALLPQRQHLVADTDDV